MARENSSYAFTAGSLVDAADVSTTTALVAAVSGKTLSLKSLYVSVTAACTITIEQGTGGANLLKFILPALGGVTLEYDPDEVLLTNTGAINILSSTADAVCARASAWMK